MIKCKVCGYASGKFEPACPQCKSEYSLTRIEVEDCLDEARSSMKRRDYDYSLLIYKTLADMGITQAHPLILTIILTRSGGKCLPSAMISA